MLWNRDILITQLQELESLNSASNNNSIIPLELLHAIDAGKNPDDLLKRDINQTLLMNQKSLGRLKALEDLKTQLLPSQNSFNTSS